MAIEAIEDVLFGFRARLYPELNLSGDMLGVNERAEGNGGGFKSAKRLKGMKGRGRRRRRRKMRRIRNGRLRKIRSECYIIRINGF